MSFLRIPPLAGVGGERLYTPLSPTACGAGEGHVVARGDCQRQCRAMVNGRMMDTLRHRGNSSWHPAISDYARFAGIGRLGQPTPSTTSWSPPRAGGWTRVWWRGSFFPHFSCPPLARGGWRAQRCRKGLAEEVETWAVSCCARLAGTGRLWAASPFHHSVVPPPPRAGVGKF